MNITGEETQADLEAMLSQYDDTVITDSPQPDGEPAEEQLPEPPEAHSQPDSDTETDATADSEPQAADPVVLAKDGKNTIPFQVLEAERMEKNQAYQQLTELRAQIADAQYKNQLLHSQISRAGMTPQESPDAMQLTAEKLQLLRQEMPDVADAIEALSGQTLHLQHLYQQQLEQVRHLQQQTVQPRQNEAHAALEANQTLNTWRDSDPARFQFACQIDSMMENDPAWSDKPLKQRFAEVTRRTCAAFGDALPDAPDGYNTQKLLSQAQQKVQQTLNSNSLPDSPSQTGSPGGAPKTLNDRIASASVSELYDLMSSMSSEQTEDLLAEYKL